MGRAGELGGHAGLNFQRAYFSDLTSLGNAQCTILRKVQKPWLVDLLDIWAIHGTRSRDWQRLAKLSAKLCNAPGQHKAAEPGRSGGFMTK
jgi:hypothetical protein